MHIAYVTADRGIPVFGSKGASVHVREMVHAFTLLGHDVTILAVHRGTEAGPLSARIIEVSVPVGSGGQLEGDAKVRASEQVAMAASEAVFEALIKLHAERPINLIYERYCLFSTAGTRASYAIGCRCALEVNSPLRLEQARYRRLIHSVEAEAVEKEVFSRAQGVFAVSEQVKTYALSRGSVAGSTQVLPNAVDCERFNPDVPAEAIEGAEGRFVIGFVGSLKPWHGLEYLMPALRELAVSGHDFHLLVVGEGPLHSWIEGYIAGCDIEDQVTLTGWTDHQRLPGLLTAMDVAVAPYPDLDDFYFSPLKLYEYMAAGVPVVASDIGQVADVIDNRDNGLLVTPGDPHALANALAELRSDQNLRDHLGRAGRATAQERTWQDNAHQVIATLCDVGKGHIA